MLGEGCAQARCGAEPALTCDGIDREVGGLEKFLRTPEAFAGEALSLMEERRQGKITSLIVVGPQGEALGVVHLHDLWASAG